MKLSCVWTDFVFVSVINNTNELYPLKFWPIILSDDAT
jgi:hypothetical protein